MKSFFSFFSLAAIILCLNTNLLSQVNIIPVRTDVTGFASWTDTDVTGTNYVQLLKATSKTISPAMDFTAYINESLSFSARTYGGVNATENVITVSISVDNGGTWTVLGTRTPTSTTMTAQADFDLSSYNGTQVKLKFSVAGTNNTVGSGIDDITITGYPPTAPTITVNPATLGGMNYVFENGPSAEQSFVIYGTNLIANISINAPTNYQISTTSGSGFTNSLTLTQSAGSVLNTTIFVRLNAGLSVATYNGQIINALSSGATTQTVTCNGIVTNPTDPAIPTSLFEIQNILVDACAGSVEGQNEMVIFQVGATSINVTDLRVDGAGASGVIENGKWPNPSNLWRGISPPPSNPADIAFVNSTITSCGFLIEPVGGILPAGKKVLMITSTAWDRTAHSFASLQDTLYVIFQNAGNTAGHFVNHGTSSERTFVLRHVPSGYGDTIIYNRSFLVTQLGIQGPEDGGAVAYTWNGTATYYNNGCQAPYIPMDPSWNFNSPSICETDAAINLNALITGTAGGVWSGTGVSGNTFDPDGLSGSIAVTYTLGTAPCDVSEMHSIIVNLNTTPLFTALGPYCVATTPASLPTTSTNSITGTWSPATISTAAVGTIVYTFTPTAGQCALSTTMSITINAANTIPSFTALGPYCMGASPASLSTTSTNGINGTWSPATISTVAVGTTVYTFTPTAGQCALSTTMSVTINAANITPSFTALGPYCVGASPASLPTTSTNSISGTWSPATISTAAAGTTVYTFTPTAGQCATTRTMSVTINANITPNFTALGPYCMGAIAGTLPTTSTNSISGTWSPSTISTASAGTTVYTFTPTAGQCATTRTMSVVVASSFTPTFSALGPYCQGATAGTLANTSTNGITGTWSPATISTATVGTTVYTFTPNAGQCAVTNTMSILVNSIPSISATGSNPNCFGNTDGSITVNITGGNPVFNIAWNGGSANTLSNSYLVSGLASGNYNITLTDLNNCIASATANLTQPTELTISVVSTPIGIFGGTSNVTVNASGGISPYTGTGVFNVGAGTYTYTVTDDNGCTASQTINISQPTELLISVSSTPINCYGELSEIIVSATGGVTPYLGTGTFYVSAGTYSYTITDNSGTTATATVVVGQPSEIILSEASNNALCFGGFGSANVNIISGGVAPYSILWQDNSTQFTNNNIPANTHFAYTVTDNNSCPITGSVSVSQPEELLITYTATNAGCFNSYDGSIELYSISGGTPPYNFIWNNGYTLPSLNNVPAGNYQVTVSDQNGCENIAQVEILQADEIFLSIVVTDELCSGAAGKLTATVTGGISPYTYLWNNSATTSEITNLNPGTYSLTVTDANHCTITQTANVNITGSLFPTIAITNPISCFSMSDGTLQANCPSAVLPNTYSWNNGITTAINQNLSSGNYSVVLTDSRGCSGNASINLVNPAEIKITSIITPISCNGEIDGAITVNINGGSNPYSFIWSNSETTATIENLNSGNYAISVTDSRNCIANASFSIIQPDVLYLDYQIHEIMCYGYRDGSLLLSASGGSRPYNFGLTQGTTQYNGNNHNRLTPGIYTIFVEDNNNCRISEDIVFQEPAPILASFTYSNPTCIGINNGFIEIEITGGILPYLFNWNENLTDIPLYGNLTQGEYEINIIDANDCELSLGTVKLEDTDIDCISIPNAFTPNADGINDTWIIENIEWFADAYIQVYNRWGQEIYGNKATAGNWDGTFNGKFVPTGTYLYVVELNNGIRAYTGMVSVVY